ncbi:MAG: ABC transporter permease [Phycisphaerae bacterium]|nr:ABC transporter permease [Phycisphaerae bacterium]
MKAGRKTASEFPPLAGRRTSALSLICLSYLSLFVVIVVTLIVTGFRYEYLSFETFKEIISSPDFLHAAQISVVGSLITLVLVVIFAVTAGYALSRYRFPGHAILDTIADIPILLPPVVVGVLLLIFFAYEPGKTMEVEMYKRTATHERTGLTMHSMVGIVLCQFIISASYAIRSAKAAYDSVDRRLEQVAMSLGCTDLQAFCRVTLPLAKNGLIAGSIMAWARAIGVFGPLVVFVGTSVRVRTLPTLIYLELSIGKEEVSLAVALVMVAMASVALAIVHWLAPGRKWH